MNDLLSALCQHLESDIPLPEKLALVENQTAQLNQEEADQLVDCLKTRADRLRLDGKTQRAFETGQVITAIGGRRGWLTYQGLGGGSAEMHATVILSMLRDGCFSKKPGNYTRRLNKPENPERHSIGHALSSANG